MVKIEAMIPIIRSRSSSSSSADDDLDSSSSSSDSDLSLIETSAMNASKSVQKRQVPTSSHLIPAGTIIRDLNNNAWMIHQCVKVTHRSERFLYLCSQVKRPLPVAEPKSANEQNIVKTKISPLMYLTEKLKQSRQAVLDRARTENDQLDYIFYGAVIGETNKDIELILPSRPEQKSAPVDLHGNKIIHGIVEFLVDDPTDDEMKLNKYAIEIHFGHEMKKSNGISHPSDLLQQILKKEIDYLKELRRSNATSKTDVHQFVITKKSGNAQYEIQERPVDEPTANPVESSSMKYLLKLELNSPASKHFTIDHEIAFYSRFATHEKLKSYIKRHNLMYIAIPEYIAHGIYKHLNGTYKFLIMDQYRENLRSLIYSYDQSLPEHNALNLFLQMLFVMQFLHEKNYVHQIIKPKYLMFANKQPYFIYLTQFRTVRSIHETTSTSKSNEVPNENRPSITNENLHVKQPNHQVKKKVKRSHRTQLGAIQNKNAAILPVLEIASPVIEEDHSLSQATDYHHPFSVYCSLDLHLNNKQTYRGDLEMLGYNLIVWSGGQLPWEKKRRQQRETIPHEKKLAKSNVNEFVKKCFFMKLISPVTLRAICDYMSTVYQFSIDDVPNFDQLRAPIKEIVKALGFKANACLRLSNSKSKTANPSTNTAASSHLPAVKTPGQLEGPNQVSSAKELEVERDDLDDEAEEEEDDDDDEDDDEDEDQPCPSGSSSCEEDVTSDDDDDDIQMEQQAPSLSGPASMLNKCQRCGGDHSLEDQQSQSSSDKQSNSSTMASNNNQTNTLTYQQKRQRSIAKRLQLRRKKKN